MKFLSLEQDFFSIDINDFSVRLIKLDKDGKDFFVSSFSDIALKPGIVESGVIKDKKALANVIKAAYKKAKGKKINTKFVAVSLPEEESFLQIIKMPKMSEGELRNAIAFEAENYIPLPIDKTYFDFQIIPVENEELDHLDVLLAAVSQKIADSYISCIKEAGFTPILLEPESLSIVRAIIKKEKSEEPVMLINFEDNKPDFIIFSGKAVRFTSSVALTPEDQEPPRSKKNQRVITENLISKIKKYVDYYKEHTEHEHILQAGNIKKIILCGEEGGLGGLAKAITGEVGIETEVGNPFVNFTEERRSRLLIPEPLKFTVALGLALKND